MDKDRLLYSTYVVLDYLLLVVQLGLRLKTLTNCQHAKVRPNIIFSFYAILLDKVFTVIKNILPELLFGGHTLAMQNTLQII